jgi:hypothetical protein
MSIPTEASYLCTFADAEPTTAKNDERPNRSASDRIRKRRQVDREEVLLALMIKCILSNASRIVVAFDPILDDPNNPTERVLRISNGLRWSDPYYQGVVLRVRLTPGGHLLHDVLECTDGNTFDIAANYHKPEPVVKARIVHKHGGIWAELNGRSVSPFVSPNLQPILMQTVADTVQSLGRTLLWEDDIYEDADEPA